MIVFDNIPQLFFWGLIYCCHVHLVLMEDPVTTYLSIISYILTIPIVKSCELRFLRGCRSVHTSQIFIERFYLNWILHHLTPCQFTWSFQYALELTSALDFKCFLLYIPRLIIKKSEWILVPSLSLNWDTIIILVSYSSFRILLR